jgi:transcriptional regulator with XRE-family HTH domain
MVSEAYGVAGGGWRGAMGARDGVSGVEAEQVVRVAVGIEMRRWREERGLSRAALATRLQDVEKHVLYTYETGRRSATVARLARICGELGVEPSRVLSNALRRVRVAQWDVAALRRAAEEARGV